MQYQSPENKAQILFIEDEPAVAESLKDCLELKGFEVTIVDKARDAVTHLSARTPDLILSDFNLPGSSGLDLFKEIKSNPIWSGIPFLFLSGESSPSIANTVMEAGGDYFIKKPINIDELSSVIQGQLSQSKLKEETTEQRFDAFKRRVVHTLSHEFRTPLVSITTGSELLLDEYDSLNDEQIKNLLTSIFRGGQRLERLVEDFMAVQQIDTGETEASFDRISSPVSIFDIVARVKDEANSRLKPLYGNIEFDFEMHEELRSIMVTACTSQIVDAFVRLIDNGCKFTLDDQRKVSFLVTKEGDSALFRIRDWGKGMPLDCSSQLNAVTPFTQIKREVHEQQGCGLGLAIATHYVKLHGGDLELSRPEDGKGMLVRVRLPLT